MDDDDVLSELINEIDEDEDSGPVMVNKQRNSTASTSAASFLKEKQATRDYMKTFSLPKRPSIPATTNKISATANKENKLDNTQRPVVEKICKSPPCSEPEETKLSECTIEESADYSQQDSVFDDDFDMTQIEEFEVEETRVKDAVTEEQLLNGWETMQQGVENATQNTVIINAEELPTVENEDGNQVRWLFLV